MLKKYLIDYLCFLCHNLTCFEKAGFKAKFAWVNQKENQKYDCQSADNSRFEILKNKLFHSENKREICSFKTSNDGEFHFYLKKLPLI
jgi:hypothetical protein